MSPFIQRFDRHLKTVSRVWAHRLSGTLEAEFPTRKRSRQISFCDGGIIDRSQFSTLNASLRSERVVFIGSNIRDASDWHSVGALLFQQARHRARQLLPEDGELPLYEVTCPSEALDVLPVSEVVSMVNDTVRIATFDERATDARALELMGLLTIARNYATAPMVLAEDDQTAVLVPGCLSGMSLDGLDLSQSVPSPASSPERLRALWAQLRTDGAASCRTLLEEELLTGMEQPSLLAFLGMCWFVDSSRPLPERVSKARRWLSFALMLESADQDVKRCIAAIRKLSHQLPPRAILALPADQRDWLGSLIGREHAV